MEYSCGIEKLKDDILVNEIFMILPASSVMALRGVCKSWRSLTTNPSFVRAHTRRHCDPNSMLVKFNPSPFSEFCIVSADTVNNQIHEPRSVEIVVPPNSNQGQYDVFYMKASCDGLICFESRYPKRKTYFICNPLTKTWTTVDATLRPYQYAFLCGFYFHRPTQKYRMLQHFYKSNVYDLNSVFEAGYEVATVNEPPWRTIHKQSSAYSLSEIRLHLEKFDVHVADRGLFAADAVTTKGNLHWLQCTKLRKWIVVFNTVVEEFKEMTVPNECMLLADIRCSRVVLDEIGGSLCIGKIPVSEVIEMDIWLMADYKSQEWTKLHRVVYEVGSTKTLLPKNEEVKMLKRWRDGFSLYDPWQNTSCHLHIPQLEKFSACLGYTESLVTL